MTALLRKPALASGPLGFLLPSVTVESLDAYRLHRLLLAYSRIQKMNKNLPADLNWPLLPLTRLFSTQSCHPDNGVRLLAIRCYTTQVGMSEGERMQIEQGAIGKKFGPDCWIEGGLYIDGSRRILDGWILDLSEHTRVFEARNRILELPDYYGSESCSNDLHLW